MLSLQQQKQKQLHEDMKEQIIKNFDLREKQFEEELVGKLTDLLNKLESQYVPELSKCDDFLEETNEKIVILMEKTEGNARKEGEVGEKLR